jgi:hypothetical protein
VPPEVWDHDLVNTVVLALREPLAGTPVQISKDGPHLKSSILIKLQWWIKIAKFKKENT